MHGTQPPVTIAITYRRVSTSRQEREGVSLEAQTDQTLDYVRKQPGWRLGGDFQDVMSGRKTSRPGYQAMLDEVRALRQQGQQVVVVATALDRMGRDLGESVRSRKELRLLNVPLHCIRENGILTELQADLLATIAADESRRIGARVKSSQQLFRGRGYRSTSKVAWGYRWVPASEAQRLAGAPAAVLELDPETSSYARELWERAAAGESVHAVAKWAAGLPAVARGGRVLRFANVLAALKNPVYVGRVEDPERGIIERYEVDKSTGDQIVKRSRRIPTPDLGALALPAGRWPALVSDDVWTTVQQRIAGHKQMGRQASGQYLLSGLIRCERCGLRMQGRTRWGKTDHLAYGCNTPGRGCNYSVRVDRVDPAVLEQIGRLLEGLTGDAALRKELRSEWARLQKPADHSGVARIKTLESVIAKGRRRQDEMLGLLADRVIDRDRYTRGVAQEQQDIDSATAELSGIREQQAPPILPDLDSVLARIGSWRQALALGSVPAAREVLAQLIETVIPERVGWGRYQANLTLTPLAQALAQVVQTAA